MGFYVQILGSGSALPTVNRNTTAQYVFCNNQHFLIDCGEGTQKQLRKNKIKFLRINHIFISHLHGDHYFGLVGLLSTMQMLGRDKNLTIYAPTPLQEIINIHFKAVNFKLNFQIKYVEINGDEARELYRDNNVIVRTFPLKHQIPTNGFIIEETQKNRKINKFLFEQDQVPIPAAQLFKEGKNYISTDGIEYHFEKYTFDPEPSLKYAFCSDTAYSEKIIPYIQNANVLYHEATFANDMALRAKKTFHSTAKQAATIALKANVKKLIIGHLSARYKSDEQHLDEAKSIFQATEVAEDNEKIILQK